MLEGWYHKELSLLGPCSGHFLYWDRMAQSLAISTMAQEWTDHHWVGVHGTGLELRYKYLTRPDFDWAIAMAMPAVAPHDASHRGPE